MPFVTRTNAITGGEKSNIINGKNGIFYNSVEELVEIIETTANEPQKFHQMSKNAREHYVNNASLAKMTQGVLDAIEYALKH